MTPSQRKKKRLYDRKRYLSGVVRAATWSKDHPIKSKRYRRDWFLRTTYGISLNDFNAILRKQRGKCRVCKTKHSRRRSLHVDHCHKTMKVRGLLCFKCNTALGKLGDDLKLVIRLVKYLEASCG